LTLLVPNETIIAYVGLVEQFGLEGREEALGDGIVEGIAAPMLGKISAS
jgi:hypothetical protein